MTRTTVTPLSMDTLLNLTTNWKIVKETIVGTKNGVPKLLYLMKKATNSAFVKEAMMSTNHISKSNTFALLTHSP